MPIYYGELLGNEEIVQIGLILTEFKKGNINYLEFKQQMKVIGYDVQAQPIDSSKLKRLKDAESLEDRVKNNTIEDRDINRYLATNENVGEIFFVYDRLMIDRLADYGEEYAIDIREHLLRTERRLGGSSAPKRKK